MSEAAGIALSDRRRAALPGSRYDRTVQLTRKALPFIAGLVAAIALVFPLTHADELSFVLAKDRVDIARERLRVSDATYRGEDTKGQAFTIRAGSGVQQSSRDPVVMMKALSATLEMRDSRAMVTADSGRYDMARQTVTAEGPIKLRSTNGYALDTRDVTVDLSSRTAESAGAVDGSMPLGTFNAGKLEADIDGRTVTLSQRARLHIVQGRAR